MAELENLEKIASKLDTSRDYCVLRRLQSRIHFNQPDSTDTKLAIYLDLETTGLNPENDEIIELAMVPFRFSSDGRIFEVEEAFDQLQEPKSASITEEITQMTGITDEMVRGRTIDVNKVTEFASSASVIIAHNAGFDRKFAEKGFDVFTTKAWACSMNEVPWRNEGFEGTKLEYLAMKNGFFYNGHRAEVDCYAGIKLLSQRLPRSGTLILEVLLEKARQATCRVWAEGSPFDFKDALKARGYRWNDGNNGKPKSWYRDVLEGELEDELLYLHSNIYQQEVEILVVRITAFDRYSERV